MRRRNSGVNEAEATTAAAITRTQSLPSGGADSGEGKLRWLRRESLTDRLKNKFNKKREEPGRSRSHSLASSTNIPLATSPGPEPSQAPKQVRSPSSPKPATAPRPKGVKIPKRVGFHTAVLATDPPQQIPPQNPRKGCVEVINGEVKLPVDRLRDLAEYAYCQPIHAVITANAAKTAHENALRLSHSLSKGGLFGRFKDEDESEVPTPKLKGDVETALASTKDASESDTDDDSYAVESTLTPEKIYTRCCHLREILPIKSMLKQLNGQVFPIAELHIVNVKPTMIEFLAFTDFLRIAAVVWVRMDSLILEPQMIKILMSSLLNSTHLTKLSFANTKLEPESWEYLCSFIANGSRLLSLDVSCTTTTTRVKPFNRETVDWGLLAGALVHCKTIDSLLLSGTMIPLKDWEDIVDRGFTNGRSISLADNNLDKEYLGRIVEWLAKPSCTCVGVDIAGNDLSESYGLIHRILYSTHVQRLNISNSSLAFDSAFAKIFTTEMATKSPLKSLELNGNPDLFPEIIDHLFATLPHFLMLRRIELNKCNLNSANVVRLCQAFVQCQELAHISLTGNQELNENAAAALCVVANTVKTIVQIDVDSSNWPDSFKHQLACYCIANLNRPNGQSAGEENDNSEMLSFEQELQSIKSGIHSDSSKEIPQHVLDRIVQLRADSRQRLGNLFKARRTRTLSLQERETMFRLFFYDSSLERVITQIKESRCKKPADQQSSVPESTHEDVHTLDTPRHSLSRANSNASLVSLKQIEEEEGTFHKLNTWLMFKNTSPDGDELEDKPHRDVLRGLLEGEHTDLSDATIQRIKSYTAKDLAREISAEH